MTDVYAASSVNVGLAIPDPKTLDLERAKDMANEIIRWSETCDDITALEDARARTAAIETYFRHRHKDVATDLARAARQLQVRIGELLPPPMPGRRPEDDEDLAHACARSIPRDDARRMRQMAEHKDDPEVAAAIEAGMSQAEVLRRIEAARQKHPDVTKKGQARVAKAREMAAEGYTSRQIADTIGIDPDNIGEFRKRHGIDVPADATVRNTRRIDADRVVREAASTLEGVAMGLDLITPDAIDPSAIPALAESMKKSLQQITRFYRAMKDQQGEQQ